MEIPKIKLLSEAVAGDTSAYIPGEAPGAIPNGSRIRKVASEPNDANPDGTGGTVVSSMRTPTDLLEWGEFFYFVRWDSRPDLVCGVSSKKVATP